VLGLRSFWQSLPAEGRWLLSTVAFERLGRGLTLPFTVIYLHEVRGFDLGLSGTLMGLIAVVALLVTAPCGALVDRYSGRTVMMAGLSSMIGGNVLLAFATHPAMAAVAPVLVGIAFGLSWPAFNALIASVVTGELRQKYFGITSPWSTLASGPAASSAVSSSTSPGPAPSPRSSCWTAPPRSSRSRCWSARCGTSAATWSPPTTGPGAADQLPGHPKAPGGAVG